MCLVVRFWAAAHKARKVGQYNGRRNMFVELKSKSNTKQVAEKRCKKLINAFKARS